MKKSQLSMLNTLSSDARLIEITQFVDFLEKPNSNIIKRLSDFKKKNFTIKNTDLSYRTLNYWISEDLIEDDRKKPGQSWKKFSYYDRLWVQLIIELRKFGLSIDKIKIVKEKIFSDTGLSKIPFNWLDYGIIRCLAYKENQTYLAIYEDGQADVVSRNDIDFYQTLFNIPSYLLVNLNQIFNETVKGDKKPFESEGDKIYSLTAEESKLLINTRSKDLDKLVVKFKDGKISLMEKCRTIKPNEDIDQIIKDLKYGTVLQKNHEGECILYEVRETQKLDE